MTQLSRMVKHASDSQRALEQRCAGLVEAVEGKTAALKVAQQQVCSGNNRNVCCTPPIHTQHPPTPGC